MCEKTDKSGTLWRKYVALFCADLLLIAGLWLSLAVFKDRNIAEGSMLHFTVADYYQIFAFPLYAIVHGVLSRVIAKKCVVTHLILMSVTSVGLAAVRFWPLFSTEVWIFVLLVVGISLVVYWLIAGVQLLFCEREF